MKATLVGDFLGNMPRPTSARVVALLVAVLGTVVALGLAAGPASAATFSNNSPITINDAVDGCPVATGPHQQPDDAGKATPYPSSIAVSGLGSSISDVNVAVFGLSHGFVEDVGLLLVSPAGQSTILMTDVGFDAIDPAADNINLTFDDAASRPLPDEGQIEGGTYKPTVGTGSPGCLAPVSFPAPAPAGPYASSLSVFNGTNPNGTWNLYVIDDATVDVGSITGWRLDINATTPVPTTKEQCRKGNWKNFSFPDQGTCITFVNENRP